MTPSEIFNEGINLMLSGMGFVLFFLFVLIYAIGFMSKVINQFFPEPTQAPSKPKTVQTQSQDDIEHLKPIIVATIAHHRKIQGLN